jgi:hypothetical protein
VIALAVAAEATSNALRAYGLGAHLDHLTVTIAGAAVSLAGAVLVAASIALSIGQAVAAKVALSPGLARQRIVSAVALVLFLSISTAAMVSHVLEAQRAKVSDESGQRGAYDRARAAYDKAASELATLEGVRTIANVRAAMDAAPVSRDVFRRTKECTDMTREDSFAACKPILDLRQEMAKAIRKHELEPEVAGLKAELAGLTRPETATASEGLVSIVWPWVMGLGVVFLATFGAVIFAAPVPPPKPKRRVSRRVSPMKPGETDAVVDWVRAFQARNGRKPRLPEVRSQFQLSKSTAWRRVRAA